VAVSLLMLPVCLPFKLLISVLTMVADSSLVQVLVFKQNAFEIKSVHESLLYANT
jgi:hypothetical protein